MAGYHHLRDCMGILPPYVPPVNDEVVHGIPGMRRLEDGDIISIDVGVCVDGLHADAARTFAVGKISETARFLIKTAEESFFEGIKNAVAGKRVGDISNSIQRYVESRGFSVVRDLVGHGIGRKFHESPQVPKLWQSWSWDKAYQEHDLGS